MPPLPPAPAPGASKLEKLHWALACASADVSQLLGRLEASEKRRALLAADIANEERGRMVNFFSEENARHLVNFVHAAGTKIGRVNINGTMVLVVVGSSDGIRRNHAADVAGFNGDLIVFELDSVTSETLEAAAGHVTIPWIVVDREVAQ